MKKRQDSIFVLPLQQSISKTGDKQETAQAYQKNIDNLTATEWLEKRFSLAMSGNFDEAIKYCNKAINLNPQYELAYHVRGICYGGLENYQQAIKDFDKAIKLEPQNAIAYNTRGAAYANLGNYQQAIKEFNKAIELNPKYANAFNNRGAAYYLLGNYEQGTRDYKVAAKLGHKIAQDHLKGKGINW